MVRFYSNTIPSRIFEIAYLFSFIIPLAVLSNKLNIKIPNGCIDKFSKYPIYTIIKLLDNIFFFLKLK